MRIPRAGGVAAPLPSRRAVLESAIELKNKLGDERRRDDAAVLENVVVTLRELMAISERKRGSTR